MVGLILAAGLLAGCGSDAPLADLGHMTERWIAAAPDAPAATSAPPSAAPIGLLATNGPKSIAWVNDGLGSDVAAPTSPGEAIQVVWARSNRQDRYVQASRSEILAALPQLEVPTLVPDEVAFITSQLIFDPATGELASDAFGRVRVLVGQALHQEPDRFPTGRADGGDRRTAARPGGPGYDRRTGAGAHHQPV